MSSKNKLKINLDIIKVELKMNFRFWFLILGTFTIPGQSFLINNYQISSLMKKKTPYHRFRPKRELIPEIDHHSIVDCLCSDSEKGIEVVKTISSLLPKLDCIAPQILHANDQIIDATLNSNWLPGDLQKKIVLNSIKFSQFGDNMGSYFLQMYYDLVDKCL